MKIFYFSLKKFFCIFLILILFSFFVPESFAQFEQSESNCKNDFKGSAGLEKYNVGILLENVGTIDRQSGSYDLIFWVTITSDEIDFTKNLPPCPDRFDFVNGYVEEISGVNIEPHFYKFKVRGVFFNSVDFHNYPFEKVELVVHLEPYYPLTSDKLVFQINHDYSGRNQDSTVSVPGWDLSDGTISSDVKKYPWGDFTHLTANYVVETEFFSSFMKKIFPIIVLIGFSFSTFAMSPKSLGERTGIISAALLSGIFFHSSFLLAEIPPIGYMTLADKIMMVAYAMFVFCLLTNLLHRYFEEVKKDDYTITDAIKFDRKMAMLTPVILGGVFTIVYFL